MLKKRKSLSVRIKLLISVLGVVLLFLSFSTYFSIKQTGGIIKDQLNSYGNSMAHTLADFSIENLLSWNYPAIQLSIDYIGEQDDQILRIKIFHEDAVVAEYISGSCKMREAERAEVGLEADCEEYIIREGLGEMYETPVILTTQGEQQELGKVQVYLSKSKYNEFLQREIEWLLILSFILLIGDTILSYLTVKVLILNPLKEIMKGTKIIGAGNFDHRIVVRKDDEIGDLAKEVNRMTSNLKTIKNKLVDTVEDIKIAKDKIEEEQHKISAIIANLIDPVIVMDMDRKMTLINPPAKEILKISESDMGKKIVTSNSKDCKTNRFCLCDFSQVIKVPYKSRIIKVDRYDYPIIEEISIGNSKEKETMEDNNKIFKVFTSPVKDVDGTMFGYMKIFYDVTREKKIDKLKSRFISIAAHQLRTPSAGVKWALQMILNGDMGEIAPEPLEYIERACQANERMVHLINDLLNISRMEAGRFIYKLDKVDIVGLVDEIIKESSISIEEKGIDIKVDIDGGKEKQINADREKLKLAFQNLIINAIKYSNKNGKIEIKMYEGDGNVYFEVKDNGIGISEENQKKLFEKFFRGDNAIRSQTEGSGLGLYIVKGIIKAHKGDIWYKTELDKGSTFYVKLPAQIEEIASDTKETQDY